VPLDLAGDRRHGEGEELHATGRVEPVDRRDQAERADLEQVVEGLAAVAEPAGEVPDEGKVLLHEDLAEPLAPRVVLLQRRQLGEQRRGALGPPPVVGDGDGVDRGLHGRHVAGRGARVRHTIGVDRFLGVDVVLRGGGVGGGDRRLGPLVGQRYVHDGDLVGRGRPAHCATERF
jgi:hypothetical protein